MSSSWPGSMRGPRVKTPLLLLLLLLLLNALTGTVLCQDEEVGPEEEGDPDVAADPTEPPVLEEPVVPEMGSEYGETQPSDPPPTGDQTSSLPITPDGATAAPEGSGSGSGEPPTDEVPAEEGLSPIIILIPVVLVVVIIGMIVCGIFINRRWNSKAKSQELNKEDPYLDGSSTEKVPMPMFEEDVPSVLELEMEELDQWMKKDC